MWKKGESGNPKGSPKGGNPGSGRPADWLKEKCREIIEKDRLVDFLGSVAKGDDIQQVVNDEGEAIQVPAPVRDRLRATEILLDRGYGKPDQSMALTGSGGDPLELLSTEGLQLLAKLAFGGSEEGGPHRI